VIFYQSYKGTASRQNSFMQLLNKFVKFTYFIAV
jgi:hypothetical protein